MNYRTINGRADLLRLIHDYPTLDVSQVALFLGFEKKSAIDSLIDSLPDLPDNSQPEQKNLDALPSSTTAVPGRDLMEFLIPVYAAGRDPNPHVIDPDRPEAITDEELAVPGNEGQPTLPPLIPWSRLGFFIRRGLGANRNSAKIDEAQFIDRVATCEPVLEIPRKKYQYWAPHAALVIDHSDEMIPYWSDLEALKRNIKKERGLTGLKILEQRGIPHSGVFSELPQDTPVLVISAMGQLVGHGSVIERWSSLGTRLRQAGHPVYALIPAPRHHWHSSLTRIWQCACWDRKQPMPHGEGLKALPHRETGIIIKKLLELLSPSKLVEPGLLRRVRFALGSEAHVGTEHAFWFHDDMLPGINATRYRVDKTLYYLNRLNQYSGSHDLELRQETAKWIRYFHKTYSQAYEAEALLRLDASCSNSRIVLEKITERMRSIAQIPLGPEGKQTGLPAWLVKMVDSLPPDIRSFPAISSALALAVHYFGNKTYQWPDGIDQNAVESELERLLELPQSERQWTVFWSENQLLFSLRKGIDSGSVGTGTKRSYAPLVGTRSRRTLFHLGHVDEKGNTDWRMHAHSGHTFTHSVESIHQLNLSTDMQRLYFARIPRPPWAERMGYDRYGLYADLVVGGNSSRGDQAEDGVRFRLRWIPPGRFLTGSPKNEKGRYNDEVQHEVTISRGFWLAETQTTQALWEVVEGNNPSHHKEKGTDRPVEQVSCEDCINFCEKLEQAFLDPDTGKPSLSFSLPTEAQWEYACRAGTESAFNDGSECTLPRGKDRALEKLGWFDENSGLKTHPVGEKQPNAWGIYDMHGNVWEWCRDWFDTYEDESQIDPFGPDSGQSRVLRGGGCWSSAGHCRSADRGRSAPPYRYDDIGFRLAAGQEVSSRRRSGEARAWQAEVRSGAGADHERGTSEKEAKASRSDRGQSRPDSRTRLVKMVGLWDESAQIPWPWRETGYPEDNPEWANIVGYDEYGLKAMVEIEGISFLFRQIMPGSFLMGSPDDEKGRMSDESPQHEVILRKGFWMLETSITQAQWTMVMGKNPGSNKEDKNLPAVNISWEAGVAFCNALNEKIPGLEAALPTEAEWEYACRAGTTSAFNDGSGCTLPTGKDPALDKLGWFFKNSGVRTHPVGEKQPNACGLYDLHGNVWEWCRDWYGPYAGEAQVDPVGPDSGQFRVLRGGGSWGNAKRCRSAYRSRYDPAGRGLNIGFRLAAGHFLVSSSRGPEGCGEQEKEKNEESGAWLSPAASEG